MNLLKHTLASALLIAPLALMGCGDDTAPTDSGTTDSGGGDTGTADDSSTPTDSGADDSATPMDGGGDDASADAAPDATADAAMSMIGAACTDATDCGPGETCETTAGDFNFPGGYCTVTGCIDPTVSCPAGSECLLGSVCVLSCAAAGECRTGYSCVGGPLMGGLTMMACLPTPG